MAFDSSGVLAQGMIRHPNAPWYGSPGQNQMRYMMNNVSSICEAAGTSVENIVRRVCFHNDLQWFSDSIQEWASSIAKYVGNKEPNTVPKIFIDGLAKIGDILKNTHLISDPPLTTFRLKNIVSGVRYDLNNTTSVVGSLPYNLNDGVASTIVWMNQEAI